MDMDYALRTLDVTEDALGDDQRAELDSKGYLVLGPIIDPGWLGELRERVEALYENEGQKAGSEFNQEPGARRLSDLVNKGEVFDGIYTHPQLLAAVAHVLERPFKLSSLNAREALKGHGQQELHADWGARKATEPFHVVNSFWLLDDFKPGNGATRLVPGTHTRAGSPRDDLHDPKADHPDQVILKAPAGTVVICNAHTWHGGTRNTSGEHRRVIHGYFTARDHPQQTDQAAHIRKRVWDRISPAARWVLDV